MNNPHESHPEIVNVVSTFQLNTKLDLRKIVQKSRNAEYNPKRFAGAIMRIANPKSTALIFQTGKIVCTGTKSIEETKIASKKFAKISNYIEIIVWFQYWICINMKPEVFPWLVYREWLVFKWFYWYFQQEKLSWQKLKMKKVWTKQREINYKILLTKRKGW